MHACLSLVDVYGHAAGIAALLRYLVPTGPKMDEADVQAQLADTQLDGDAERNPATIENPASTQPADAVETGTAEADIGKPSSAIGEQPEQQPAEPTKVDEVAVSTDRVEEANGRSRDGAPDRDRAREDKGKDSRDRKSREPERSRDREGDRDRHRDRDRDKERDRGSDRGRDSDRRDRDRRRDDRDYREKRHSRSRSRDRRRRSRSRDRDRYRRRSRCVYF